MQNCVRKFITTYESSALLLVDIGVWPFHDLLENYPHRAKNIGIFEAGTVSLAAGLSVEGIIPTIYGISPFIVQRALEQIKLDFVYQKLGGNFIVTGASYDFSTLGYSHYCLEDIATLKLLPGLEIVTPGTPNQFSKLWSHCHNNNKPTYYRLSDYSNNIDVEIEFGKANVIKRGKKGVVISIAETFDIVHAACKDVDVTLLYYTTISPFDYETLRNEFIGNKVVVVSPFYQGSVSDMIHKALQGSLFSIYDYSVPLEIPRNYGTKQEKDQYYGINEDAIRNKLKVLFND